ncbi:MAG: Lar family restriction alleviation protein [Methylobacter sp.]
MNIELLLCPFCGEQPSTTPRFCMGYAGDGISCRCGAETPKHLTGIEATQWWNRRSENNGHAR